MRGHGSLHVLTGCMFSGKTEELLRLLRRASVGGAACCAKSVAELVSVPVQTEEPARTMVR